MAQGYGGVPAGPLSAYLSVRDRNEERGLGELQQVGAVQGLLAKMQAQQQEQQFRAAIAGAKTPEEQAQIAAKFAGPEGVMRHADRAAQIAATKESSVARLQQASQQLEMHNQFNTARIEQMKDETARKRESDTWQKIYQSGQQAIAKQLADLKSEGGTIKPPSGYHFTAEGNLEAIPGGPADTKLQGVLNQDTANLNESMNSMDRLASEANALKEHAGLPKATGKMSWVPGVGGLATIPGTDAANFQARLGTLKSQVAFGVLQNMRNNSKTGGALGQVSNIEEQMLMANLAAIDKAQSPDEFKAALERIIDYTDEAKDRLRSAYNMKHGEKKTKTNSTPAGLPTGSKLIGKTPDGKEVYQSPDGKRWIP